MPSGVPPPLVGGDNESLYNTVTLLASIDGHLADILNALNDIYARVDLLAANDALIADPVPVTIVP
jgi:hypothetical protein